MGCGAPSAVEPVRHSPFAIRHCRGFTLLELMMVVAIVGLIMATGVPAILSLVREAPLRKAVNDVLEICSHARAQAILQEKTMTVVFHPRLREVALSGGAASSAASVPITRAGQAPVNSAKFADSVTVEGLGVNELDDTDADEALVHFFPNGTSDEMTLVLSSGGKYRKITLEVTTALASVSNVR
jgi:prepilin-type N-terminal cleavage/methylation domain-containing protein